MHCAQSATKKSNMINDSRLIDKWRAGYIERCTSGSGGGIAETARESGYGAAVPTL